MLLGRKSFYVSWWQRIVVTLEMVLIKYLGSTSEFVFFFYFLPSFSCVVCVRACLCMCKYLLKNWKITKSTNFIFGLWYPPWDCNLMDQNLATRSTKFNKHIFHFSEKFHQSSPSKHHYLHIVFFLFLSFLSFS